MEDIECKGLAPKLRIEHFGRQSHDLTMENIELKRRVATLEIKIEKGKDYEPTEDEISARLTGVSVGA